MEDNTRPWTAKEIAMVASAPFISGLLAMMFHPFLGVLLVLVYLRLIWPKDEI